MRPIQRLRTAFAGLILATGIAPAAPADLGPLEPLADLHRAVRESLGLPEPLIVRLLERGLPEPELPVVGLVAARIGVAPERLVDLRLAGRSWIDITIELGGSPEIFYVPFEHDPGPPYGKAWGYYRKAPRTRWHTVRLTDTEVIDLANVKLCVDHYGLRPARVVEMRRDGKSYAKLHAELAAQRANGEGKAANRGAKAKGKPKGKPQGRPGGPPRGRPRR
jgi:hypothetical protein